MCAWAFGNNFHSCCTYRCTVKHHFCSLCRSLRSDWFTSIDYFTQKTFSQCFQKFPLSTFKSNIGSTNLIENQHLTSGPAAANTLDLFHYIQMFFQTHNMFKWSWALGISFLQTIINLKARGRTLYSAQLLLIFSYLSFPEGLTIGLTAWPCCISSSWRMAR